MQELIAHAHLITGFIGYLIVTFGAIYLEGKAPMQKRTITIGAAPMLLSIIIGIDTVNSNLTVIANHYRPGATQ